MSFGSTFEPLVLTLVNANPAGSGEFCSRREMLFVTASKNTYENKVIPRPQSRDGSPFPMGCLRDRERCNYIRLRGVGYCRNHVLRAYKSAPQRPCR